MPSLYRLLCTTILVVTCTSLLPAAQAQHFRSFSGRNHPHLSWQIAETAHFQICYPAHLAGLEAQAAAIAETTYQTLSANLGVTFDRKLRIYLSDEDDIGNGFAVSIGPQGTGYTQIWVHVNDALLQRWTGSEKWLRKVLAHELAHLFHYRAVRSNLGPFAYAFSDPLPRFWTEGLAQYATERWDAQRGDRWLRTAVLDDALSYQDGRSVWNGRLLYAVGNSQMRYFAAQYGDSTLTRLLAHRRPALLGLGRVHDFGAAFQATTGRSYRRFYDDWRRHINVYYNTLAGQMAPLPDTARVRFPGQYVYDVQVSPSGRHRAAVVLPSLARPVRRLIVTDPRGQEAQVVAEGSIRPPFSWSPSGSHLAFARTGRGPGGALESALYVVRHDGRGLRRLTDRWGASHPAFGPDSTLAFVATTGPTAQLYVRSPGTTHDRAVTTFTGDVQLGDLRWHPGGTHLVASRFDAEGQRTLILVEVATGEVRTLTDALHDDRSGVWSPDGRRLAFTSLRDAVPNVFIYHLEADTTHRATFYALGASVHDWLPPDSVWTEGRLLLTAQARKSEDVAFYAAPTPYTGSTTVRLPEGYTAWLTHQPPATLPVSMPADPTLVQTRRPYRSLRELTHIVSLAGPYALGVNEWGVGGVTSWLEPLGHHVLVAFGGLALTDPAGQSFGEVLYVNNVWKPTIQVQLYRSNTETRLYGRDVLFEELTGGEVEVDWPLDVRVRPYTSTRLGTRLRYATVTPLEADELNLVDNLVPPQEAQQADLQVSLTRRRVRPYRYNAVHPLDDYGLRARITGAASVLGADVSFLRGDLAAWTLQPMIGAHRLFLYGRAQAQTGTSLPQDYLGFSRYDEPAVPLGVFVPIDLQWGDAERVRGYRAYAFGNRVLFGSAEYRALLLPDLQTRLLGVISLGSTALAAFADAGLVWSDDAFDDAEGRVGVGLELKNGLRLFNALTITHAVGLAQPAADVGTDNRLDLYYRLRAAVPF
ncbi:MAG: hypothetical protein AAF970_09805 [Bacteroidota bacterium]